MHAHTHMHTHTYICTHPHTHILQTDALLVMGWKNEKGKKKISMRKGRDELSVLT